MRTLNLTASASVILGGTGSGTAAAGPSHAGETWQTATIAVSVSANTNEAQCYVYKDSISPGNLIGATSKGSTGDSCDVTVRLYPGNQIIAAWSGGDANATATLSIIGQRTVP